MLCRLRRLANQNEVLPRESLFSFCVDQMTAAITRATGRLPVNRLLTLRRRERSVDSVSGLMPPRPWLPRVFERGALHINSALLHS